MPGWRGKQRDANEPEVVRELQALGFIVYRLDVPADLAVLCRCGRWYLVEVKNPTTHKRLSGHGWRTATQAKLPAPVQNAIIEVTEAERFLRSPRRSCNCPVLSPELPPAA